MTDTITLDTTEAAALEGLVELTPAAAGKHAEFVALREQAKALDAQQKAVRDELASMLEDAGAQGFIRNGRVLVRRSTVNTARADTKLLKARFPKIYAQVVKVTESVRITVSD